MVRSTMVTAIRPTARVSRSCNHAWTMPKTARAPMRPEVNRRVSNEPASWRKPSRSPRWMNSGTNRVIRGTNPRPPIELNHIDMVSS